MKKLLFITLLPVSLLAMEAPKVLSSKKSVASEASGKAYSQEATQKLYDALGIGDLKLRRAAVRKALEEGADPNYRARPNGLDILGHVVFGSRSQDFEIAEMLLNYGANPDALEPDPARIMQHIWEIPYMDNSGDARRIRAMIKERSRIFSGSKS